MKTCTKCNLAKDESEFYTNGAGRGRRPDCKACTRKRTSAYYQDNFPSWQAAWVLKEYGLTLEQAEAIWYAERCAVCGTEDRGSRGKFYIDHDHASGTVREPLCGSCNTMLGMARDNPTILRAGADYLEKHRDS